MALVPRVRELGVVSAVGGVELVVVGDVGSEATDLLAFTGETDDLGKLLGSFFCDRLIIIHARGIDDRITYLAQGCRPSPA